MRAPIGRPSPSSCSRVGVGFPERFHARPHPSDASRHLVWRRPPPIVYTGKGGQGSPHSSSVSQRQDGPHLKPAASPVPRPLGGASKLTLAAARALGGFTRRGRARGAEAKVCAPLGPLGQLIWGPGVRRARTGLRAALGRARAGKGGHPEPGARVDCPGRGRGKCPRILGEPTAGALLQPCRGSLRRPGPRPSRWRRAVARGSGCLGPRETAGERRRPGAPAPAAGPRAEAK